MALVLPPWSSGDQPLAIGTSLMAATATEDFVAAVVDELHQAVDRLSNPLLPPSHLLRSGVQSVELCSAG